VIETGFIERHEAIGDVCLQDHATTAPISWSCVSSHLSRRRASGAWTALIMTGPVGTKVNESAASSRPDPVDQENRTT
jgi:hypothetical protein